MALFEKATIHVEPALTGGHFATVKWGTKRDESLLVAGETAAEAEQLARKTYEKRCLDRLPRVGMKASVKVEIVAAVEGSTDLMIRAAGFPGNNLARAPIGALVMKFPKLPPLPAPALDVPEEGATLL